MIRGTLLVSAAAVTLVAAVVLGTDLDQGVVNDATARQFNYYDELDLERFWALESEFGESSRVFSSVNATRFGRLEVRAKLVVPRNDSSASHGLLKGNDPYPVLVMLDYALVSCANGCEIGILTDNDERTTQYRASHDRTETKRKKTRAPLAANRRATWSVRHASMVVIEGDDAREAIRQINGSRSTHVFVNTAVHGIADFEFDISGQP